MAAGRITPTQLRELPFRRVTAGVYADPVVPHDHQLYCRGVGLVLPLGAAIGGHSAATWFGAPHARVLDAVTVVRPEHVRWGGRRGTTVHRTDLAPHEVVHLDDVPVTTALRTAWDLAVLESTTTAVAAIDAMLRAGSLDLNAFAVLVESSAGRWGISRVRQVLALCDARAESPPESWVRVLMARAGLAPVPQFEVWADGRFVARVDLGWPDLRVAVEYEGAHHFDPEQAEADRVRLAALTAAGWIVVRVYAHDLHDWDAVLDRIKAALRSRGWIPTR